MPTEPLREGLRDRKKAETRARILEVAGRLFRAQGYAGTPVEQICREAAVSLPTLFRYFPSKADLLFDGADAVVDEWRTLMTSGPEGEQMIDALRRATHALAFKTPERGSVAQLRAELAPHDEELRRKALEIDARLLGRIAGILGELLGLDPRSDVRPFLLAMSSMAAVRAAQHVVGHQPRRVSLETRLNEAFDALAALDRLLTRPVRRPATGATKRTERAGAAKQTVRRRRAP